MCALVCQSVCVAELFVFGSLEGQPRNRSTNFKYDVSYAKLALTAWNIIFGFTLINRYFCTVDINTCACACLSVSVCVADLYLVVRQWLIIRKPPRQVSGFWKKITHIKNSETYRKPARNRPETCRGGFWQVSSWFPDNPSLSDHTLCLTVWKGEQEVGRQI